MTKELLSYMLCCPRDPHSFPTRRSSDLALVEHVRSRGGRVIAVGTTSVRALETSVDGSGRVRASAGWTDHVVRSEEHTSELQSRENLVCRLLLEKKNNTDDRGRIQGDHE